MMDTSLLFEFDRVEFFWSYCSLKSHILFYSNGLAITHIKVNYDRYSAILNLVELRFFRAYLYLKSHILISSNGLAIWYGLPDIRHIQVNYGR